MRSASAGRDKRTEMACRSELQFSQYSLGLVNIQKILLLQIWKEAKWVGKDLLARLSTSAMPGVLNYSTMMILQVLGNPGGELKTSSG